MAGEIRNIVNKPVQAFTGCDMIAHFNNKIIGNMGAVTLSVTREVVPIYTTGSPNPRCFVKGKRGIAGSLVFSMFDRHAILHDVFEDYTKGTRRGAIEAFAKTQATTFNTEFPLATDASSLQKYASGEQSASANTLADRRTMLDQHIQYLYSTPIKFSDEIPPFNITITFVNENGAASTMSIYGVQLINETQAFTMDDLTGDLAVTYVARDVDPLVNLTTGSASFTI